jgi:hypothetical protein
MWHCYIREEDIAFSCTLIPAEHRVDSGAKLIAGSFVDAACIHPEVLEVIFGSPFSAEAEFGVAGLLFANAGY